jgi:hypothetical protein
MITSYFPFTVEEAKIFMFETKAGAGSNKIKSLSTANDAL